MSDYIFILESHLDPGQNRVVAEVQRIATEAGMSVWLTGGSIRDVLSGARVADLDFTVEHDAVKTGKALASLLGGTVVQEDSSKRFVELQLPGGIRASVSNARTEKYLKPGGKAQVQPAGIHEDLSRRDFTINAMALTLNRGSRGLLVDPANGQADLANHELRATNPFIFVDDPSRIFRLIRFQFALGFEPVPRLCTQLENALSANYQSHADPKLLAREIRAAAAGRNSAVAIEAFEKAGLLKIISPALTGSKLNLSGITKFEKLAESVLPSGTVTSGTAFLQVLTEKLSIRERAEAIRLFDLPKHDADALKHLPALAHKLEVSLASAKVARPSSIYEALHGAGPDTVLAVLYSSTQRTVQDRIRMYFQKYLAQADEITSEMVEATGVKPGTPKYLKAQKEMIATHLNARPKKVVEGEPEVAPTPTGSAKKT